MGLFANIAAGIRAMREPKRVEGEMDEELRGFLDASTENKRRARVYEVTAMGRKQLHEEEQRWTSITAAIGQVLEQA